MCHQSKIEQLEGRLKELYKLYFGDAHQAYLDIQQEAASLLKREPEKGIFTKFNGVIIQEMNCLNLLQNHVTDKLKIAKEIIYLNREIKLLKQRNA